MQCQECDKTATFHITELAGGKLQEVHLCEDHAQEYLSHGQEGQPAAPTVAGVLKQQLDIELPTEDLARLDKRTCPVCGISFYEFRNQGRFGCPHDYVCFADELEPLLVSIHGETKHMGKCPQHSATDSAKQTELIRLRREMKEAVSEENYERASKLRDVIRRIETQVGGKPAAENSMEESGD